MEQGGQLMSTTEVDNWPGDVIDLQGPDLMERMKQHALRFNTELIFDHINKVDECSAKKEAQRTKLMIIISSKGTMDGAYPTFILATTAAALGWDVSILFTFYGVELLKKDLNPKISPLGNPAMPMKMPFGPEWLKK
jgi:thioredoxin reductase